MQADGYFNLPAQPTICAACQASNVDVMYCVHRVVQLTVSLLTHTGPLLVCNKDSNACITLGGFTGISFCRHLRDIRRACVRTTFLLHTSITSIPDDMHTPI